MHSYHNQPERVHNCRWSADTFSTLISHFQVKRVTLHLQGAFNRLSRYWGFGILSPWCDSSFPPNDHCVFRLRVLEKAISSPFGDKTQTANVWNTVYRSRGTLHQDYLSISCCPLQPPLVFHVLHFFLTASTSVLCRITENCCYRF